MCCDFAYNVNINHRIDSFVEQRQTKANFSLTSYLNKPNLIDFRNDCQQIDANYEILYDS